MRPEQLPAVFRDLFLKQLDEVEEIYKKLVSILPDLNYDLYLWAWHIVNTRCIYVENPRHPLVDSSKSGDTIAVIPLVDMLNHSPKPQVLPLFDKRSQCYVVNVQSSAVLEEEQLFVCYGPHDNGKLWLEYGFMLPENIHNRVSIPLELFIALTKKLGLEVDDEHISVLREAGLPNTIYASDEAPSYGLKKNCQILRMSHHELLNWREKIYSHESDDEESEEVIERDNLVNDILKQLMASLRSRAEGVDEKLVWLWEEQIDLIQKLVDNKNV
uniref:SET domain-containing protein n=1 Tax=Acrobeloides nanus TaxID=290746 RepID=A0A914EG42_9BILA